ncbi:hypothetical protein PVK06_007417 [Gossypium arboreum]|uniref:Uncharacterized protein n=1 Tax=Gossypium arboreum TaxID=29729 RepID=A0ABR0QI69_GOSAR|nr:hypothetical protein PVK06_007417 [Gossypium arboreum]
MESFTSNVDVIKWLFSEEQIKRILEIPTVDRSQPNVLVWRCDDSSGWHHEQPEYWMEEAPVSVVELVERERTGNEKGVRE